MDEKKVVSEELGNVRLVSIADERAGMLNMRPCAAEIEQFKEQRAKAEEDRNYKYVGDLLCSIQGSSAIVPVNGVILPRRNFWTWVGYATAAEDLEALPRLLPDTVKVVVLNIDSPGGLVEGVPEAGKAILGLRKKKTVIAFAHFATSAAYWIASQADEIYMMPSGTVGSIGVRAMHVDMSRALEEMGLEVTEFASPEKKNEMSPYKPLSEDTKKRYQAKIEALRKDFERTVAKGRGVKTEVVAISYGAGGTVDSKEALAAGMVDKVVSFENFMSGNF